MLNEILMAIVQAITEFLPISSSGHLALFGNLINKSDLFLITFLHIASLFAVLIFTRKEVYKLITFKKQTRKIWIYLVIATIPAGLFGFLFKELIEQATKSYLTISLGFFFTGTILLLTKIKTKPSELNYTNSVFIGLLQMIALFPGVSRSGMTISAGKFSGIEREKAVKFSFLLFIPLSIGAMILEFGEFYLNFSLIIAFLICFILSFISLQFLTLIIKKDYFWIFGIYAIFLGIISLILELI